MKKNLKMSAAILAAVMVMGSLTACGGSSSDPTTAAAAKDTTAAAADSGSSAAADSGSATGDVTADVQKIIDAGVLKVGVKTDVPASAF